MLSIARPQRGHVTIETAGGAQSGATVGINHPTLHVPWSHLWAMEWVEGKICQDAIK